LTVQIFFSRSLNFMNVQTFSMIFASGDCNGQFNTSTSFSCFQYDVLGYCPLAVANFRFFLINYFYAGNKAFWYILIILAAFKLSVKKLSKSLLWETAPNMNFYRVFNSPLSLLWVDQIWWKKECAQKELSSEKITLFQSRSKFSSKWIFFRHVFWTIAVSSLCFVLQILLHESVNVFL